MIYTQRILWPQYNSDEKLQRLFRFLDHHRPLTREISFFTETDGSDWRYVPAEEVIRRAEVVMKAVQLARESGFTPVVNILNTIGHGNEGGPEAPILPWRGMVGIDGVSSRQCSCPADLRFLEYVAFKYERFAYAKADRYWIDDDVRMGNHGTVGWGCFCSECLSDFSRSTGRTFSRQALAEALRSEPPIRDAWCRRNGDIIVGVLQACAEGVRRSHPEAEIGLMSCDAVDLADTEADFKRWFETLSGSGGGQTWLRPGGGFWNDDRPRDMLGKIHAVANTIDRLPSGVGVTYECENYPFMIGAKSAVMTGLECLVATVATRLDGIMFDLLDASGNDPAPYGPWLTELQKWEPLWNQAARLVSGTVPVGWLSAYSMRHFQQHPEKRLLPEMRGRDYIRPCSALQLAGVPVTGFSQGALGYLLGGAAAVGMNKEELQALLEKPLIMDGEAAQRFLDFGLGEKIGIKGVTIRSEGVVEVFSDHALNGVHAGYRRAVTMSYFGQRSYILEPSDKTESLSIAQNFLGDVLGSALTLYHGPDVPSAAVIGHLPWNHLLSPQRMDQMRSLSRSMLGDAHPMGIESYQPVVFWYRKGLNGEKPLTAVLNAGFDPASVRFISSLAGATIPMPVLMTPGVAPSSSDGLVLPGWGLAVLQ